MDDKRKRSGWPFWIEAVLYAFVAAVVLGVAEEVIKKAGFDIKLEVYLEILIVTLCLVIVFLVMRHRRATQIQSILNWPGAFLLARDELTRLIHREEDITKLVDECLIKRLVFVDGASGVGKSALLRLGLPPALMRRSSNIMPVYVRDLDAGGNWQEAAYASVEHALRETFKEEQFERLKASAYVRRVIGSLHEKGKIPLLILDQFDDYRSNYKNLFLRDNSWIDSNRLCKENAFWRYLRAQLHRDTIRLMISTRTDADVQSLRSVEFLDGSKRGSRHIPPLPSYSVEPMLEGLAESYSHGLSDQERTRGVISNLEATWPDLLKRLEGDLTRQDEGGNQAGVFPQEVRLVLAGLPTLPGRVLTVDNYEDAGEAAGLAAQAVKHLILQVADDCGLPEQDIVRMLVELSDLTGDNPLRRSQRDLCNAHDNVSSSIVANTLAALEKQGLVRRSVDPLDPTDIYWQLYHRNLATPIRRIDRDLNPWRSDLDSGIRRLGAAISPEERRQALLSPLLQLRLWWSGFDCNERQRDYLRQSRKRLYRPIAGVGAVVVVAISLIVFYIMPAIDNWRYTRALVHLGASAPRVDPFDGHIHIRFPSGVDDSALANASGYINYYRGQQPVVEIGFSGKKVKLDSLRLLTGVWGLDIRGAGLAELPSLAPLTALRSLKLQSIADLRPLKDLQNLEGLYVYFNNDTADLAPLGQIPALKALYISGKGVRALPPLGSLKNLERLSLAGTSVTDLRPLRDLKNAKLSELHLPNMGANDLSPISELYYLTTLDLSHQTSIPALEPIKNLPLEALSLEGDSWLTGKELAFLPKSLKRLDLGDTGVSNLGGLIGMRSLQELDLTGDRNIDDLLPLNDLPSLESLSANSTAVADLGQLRPQVLANLKRLGLWKTNVVTLAPLLKLPRLNLEVLDLPRGVPKDERDRLKSRYPQLNVREEPGDLTRQSGCIFAPPGRQAWWSQEKDAEFLEGGHGNVGNPRKVRVSGLDFTIATWVKIDSQWNRIGPCYDFGCDQSIVDKMNGFGLPNTDGWRLLWQSQNRQFWFCTGGGAINGCRDTTAATSKAIGNGMLEDRWYHVVGVKTIEPSGGGITLTLYLDGELQSRLSVLSPQSVMDSDSADFRIGSSAQEGAYLVGSVDDVQLFDRGLSGPEITAIYGAGRSGMCEDAPLRR